MRVLHINSYYFAGKFYKNLYDEQKKSGIDLDVYIPVAYGQVNDEFEYGDYSKISNTYGKLDRYFYFLKHNKILDDVQQQYDIKKYDIIHAHSLFSNGYIAYKLRKKYNIPYVVAVRNTDINIFFKYMFFLRKLGIDIMLNASKVIFISQPYKDFCLKKYVPHKYLDAIFSKTEIISNGIDSFWSTNINSNRACNDLNSKNISILSVGDLNTNKNQLTTLEACKILQNRGYNVTFNIVGKIVEKSVYDKLCEEDFVIYHGVKTKEELINYYRDNDIFVMPSIHETFGLTYAEALSQKLPIIYTSGQGFDGQFTNGSIGYSVDCNNPVEIANRVCDILDNYNFICNETTKDIKRFAWSNIKQKYDNVYSEII